MNVKLKDYEQAWRTLLNTDAGAALVEWMVYTFDGAFDKNNERQTAYALGQRDVALTLKSLKEKKTDG